MAEIYSWTKEEIPSNSVTVECPFWQGLENGPSNITPVFTHGLGVMVTQGRYSMTLPKPCEDCRYHLGKLGKKPPVNFVAEIYNKKSLVIKCIPFKERRTPSRP